MQTTALIIAVILAVIIILLIVLLLRTRRQSQIFLEEEEADEETPIVVYSAVPAISRYPLFDLRRQPPGMLNIPPSPSHPLLFNHPNGARLGRGPHYYS